MTTTKHKIAKLPLIVLALLATAGLLVLLVRDFWPEIQLLLHYNTANRARLITMVQAHGLRDMLFLLLIVGLLNAVPGASNSVICIFAGLCYGPWIGFALNWAGNILGNCVVSALITRLNFSRKFKKNRILDRLMKRDHPEVGLTLGYMVPVIPSILVNYSAVQLKIPKRQHLAMVMIGMLPTSFLYAFGGDAIIRGSYKRIALVVVVIIALILLRKVAIRERRRLADRKG